LLTDEETEKRVNEVLAGLVAAYSILLMGKTTAQLKDLSRRIVSDSRRDHIPILDQAYIAGRVASILGPNKVKTMSADAITDWLATSDFELTPTDDTHLDSLKRDTGRWIDGRTGVWTAAVGKTFSKADRDWTAYLSSNSFDDAGIHAAKRAGAVEELMGSMFELAPTFKHEAQRLLQTEVVSYFQQGQVAHRSKDEYVYKIPRAAACSQCIRLHIGPDGRPKVYRLGDVLGNSNVGAPAYAWRFTIGPVHPHCYCVLYHKDSNDLDKVPGFDADGLFKSVSHCGDIKELTLYDDQLSLLDEIHDSPALAEMHKIITAVLDSTH